MPIQITGTVRCGNEQCGAEAIVTLVQPTNAGHAVETATASLTASLAGWQTTGLVLCPGCTLHSGGAMAVPADGGNPPKKHNERRGLATVGQSN